MIREALDNFKISPNLTETIMREISRTKPCCTFQRSKPVSAVGSSSFHVSSCVAHARFWKPAILGAFSETL